MNNRVKELRQLHSITQEELAIRCEVSRQTIISLEKGKYDPSIHLARKIAVLFHVMIEDVFLFEEDEV